MAKIAVGKIGQKLIFDRMSPEARRSNTNGNYGTYKTLKLMFELNPHNDYVIVGESDYNEQDYEKFPNVCTLENDYKASSFDYGLFIPGIKGRDDYTAIISFLNVSKIPWFRLTMDPRTTHQFDDDLCNKPVKTFTQVCNDKEDEVYVPLHLADAYECEILLSREYNFKSGMFCVANEVESYDRVGEILRLTSQVENVKYAGRWSNNKRKRKCNYLGELSHLDVLSFESQALCSLIAPVHKGWVTSKYVELLVRGVIPLACCEYGGTVGLDFGAFNCDGKSPEYVAALVKVLEADYDYYNESLISMRTKFGIYDAVNGKTLNDAINSEVNKYVC